MAKTYTLSDMREAFNHGIALGVHDAKMDDRNDHTKVEDDCKYRSLMKQKGLANLTSFDDWVTGRFGR